MTESGLPAGELLANIDFSKLGRRVLFDTNALIFALEADPDTPERQFCRGVWEYLLAKEYRILVATVSLVEFMVSNSSVKFPNVKEIEVCAFDRATANDAATWVTKTILKDYEKGKPNARRVMSVDVQIVAIARHWKATSILSNDDGLRKIADLAGKISFKPTALPILPLISYPTTLGLPGIK